jgi:Flp pilus assembly CpaE family ATPase
MGTIHCGLLIAKSHVTAELLEGMQKNGVAVTVFHTLSELESATFQDVIAVHESYLGSLDRRRFAQSALIVLCSDMSRVPALFPKLEELSAFTVLPFPSTPATFAEYVRKAYDALVAGKRKQAEHAETGRFIAVTSFANGTGKTLLAYNLAAKLGSFFPDNSVCLVDMNDPFSMGKAMLGIDEQFSWNTLRPILKEGTVGAQRLANIVYRTKHRFDFMGGPTDYETNEELTVIEWKRLAESLREVSRISIIDMPCIRSEKDLQKVSKADQVLIVVDASSAGILHTFRGVQIMRERYPELMDSCMFILNKADERSGRTSAIVSSRLGLSFSGVIDEDGEAVRSFTENGKLFDDPGLLVDKQLYDIAELVLKRLF